MTVLLIIVGSAAVLLLAGRFYSRFLARSVGEDPSRTTPALARADGRDYVATPTPVVFAHHFASIAGAGPILGPVIAVIYGWAPALLWVLLGGVFIGAVHDYLATYMATREGGQSVATVARRVLGKDAFLALTVLVVLMLALVCATFLNASATALTSKLPFERLGLAEDQTLLRVEGTGNQRQAVIGGIASMSVVCITAVAPLLGYLYIKRKVSVWLCSVLAILICGASITIGVYYPIPLEPFHWKMLISAYVLVAAGVPVWIFLQSRDFINVHILYVGMAALFVTLIVGGARGGGPAEPIPAFSVGQGAALKGPFWPMLFILIACGAVSGFHSLCASGTTCKQLTSERAARRIGYYGMLLESFLAACVIAVVLLGATRANYFQDVHAGGNWILGFAMAVGNAARQAYGAPVAVGAIAGMVLLEGFLVTTLDTAIRLTRYLIEEVWRCLFEKYDVFAAPVGEKQEPWRTGEPVPAGAGGLPAAPATADAAPAPPRPHQTSGALRAVFLVMRQYWFNSALAVTLMLTFALTGARGALWATFATSNQLLAAMVLGLASIWLLRRGRKCWYALLPALAMLATTVAALILMIRTYWGNTKMRALLVADIVIFAITIYLLVAGLRAVVAFFRRQRAVAAVGAE
jgi:carbon starvation protein